MGRNPFWPSDNMKTACQNGIKARGKDYSNWDIKREWRLDYQNRVERNEFKGPKVAEMKENGKNYEMGNDMPGEFWDFEDVTIPGRKRVKGSFPRNYNQTPIKPHTNPFRTKYKRVRADLEEKPEMTNKQWPGDFFDWYCKFIQPTFPNPKPMGEIHQTWADELDSDDQLIMVKPRDHFKTTYISVGYTLYNICEKILYNVYPTLIYVVLK